MGFAAGLGLFERQGVEQVQALQLVLFEQNRDGLFQEVYSSEEILKVYETVDPFLDLLLLADNSPVFRFTVDERKDFIH